MKKALKIAGISLGALVGLVLIVICVALYVVFTPKRLTPIVNKVADDMLVCQHELKSVELTFFSTFPFFGVAIDGVQLYTEQDTLLKVDELVAFVNVKKAIDGDIEVQKLLISNLDINVCIDSLGQGNYDILVASEDTVSAVEDTTSGGWTVKSVCLSEPMKMNVQHLRFTDKHDSLFAQIEDFRLSVELPCDTQTHVLLTTESIDFTYKTTQYANNLKLRLDLPAHSSDYQHFFIDSLALQLNDFLVSVKGYAGIVDSVSYDLDLEVATNDWQISELLALVPADFGAIMPPEIQLDGKIAFSAQAKGVYSPTEMPLVDARVWLKNGHGNYDKTVLPYDFSALDADIFAHVDLNKKDQITATIHKLYAKTGKTSVQLSGKATHILKDDTAFVVANPFCDLKLRLNVNLPEFNQYIATEGTTSTMKGVLSGNINVQTQLNDVTEERYNRVKLNGDLAIRGLDVQYEDTIFATADLLKLGIKTHPTNTPNLLVADCELGFDKLRAKMGKDLNANLSFINLKANAQVDIKDTTAIPTADIQFAMGDVDVAMDTIVAFVKNPKGLLAVGSTKHDKQAQRVNVNLSADQLQASMGKDMSAKTANFSIAASARYNKKADNLLLKWNPRLDFNLEQAQADLATLPFPVVIPQIKFNYSNRDFKIDTSNIILGNSNFSLAGEIHNLGKWLRKEGIVEGEMRFTSEMTDVDELLAIVNSLEDDTEPTTPTPEQPKGADSDEPQATQQDSVSEPFMVPQQMNVSFVTNIKRAKVFGEDVRNLGGKIYINDGVMILEEMGFICDAAKLQLQAMYKTPRKDHIYAGFDYHMVDVDVHKLIEMIPQVDTLLPMLRTFEGKIQFHIAAETFVNSQYQLKPSTLRGACALEGKDLVVLDNETFNTISKLLLFKKKTENKVDSISAQITLYKDLVTVYPFCVTMDKYMVAMGGSHYLDMSFDYHVCALKPVYLGVDVKGNFDDMSIKLAKAKYAKDFRPHFHRDVDENAAQIRQLISNSLKKNVKIKSDTDNADPKND